MPSLRLPAGLSRHLFRASRVARISAIGRVFLYAATQIYGSLIHTKAIHKMGWLEHVLVTPSHHRVHHASNSLHLDRNMGMCLILWDKLFGTFQKELPEDPPAMA